jgi:ATP-dependent DNA helicase DinG
MLTPSEILGPDGRIAARLSNYERREQQLKMAEAVSSALAEGRHLVVEAGTGVGKSFAYLVPAILAATERQQETAGRRRPIVVSTHTISLQEQLLTKDLPLLQSVIPREFTAVLVKGRRNYVSLRRLGLAVSRAPSLFANDNEIEQLRDLQAWAKKTSDGSLSDLTFQPLESVWDEAASDSSNCMGRDCPTHKQCHYFRSRRRALHAQILIVNHALLFSDLALRRLGASILPDYDSVVLDEAHTVEAVAGEHLGMGVTSGQVDFILRKLYNERANKGLLAHYKLREPQLETTACRARAERFFDDVRQWMSQRDNASVRVRQPKIVSNPLSPALSHLADLVKQCGDRIRDEAQRHDFTAACERLVGLSGDIESWLSQSDPASVYWIECGRSRRGRARLRLAAAPIDVGPALRELLFDKTRSVILTSATLAVGREASFDFFRSRIGLTQCDSLRLGSPFDYRRQVRLILVQGAPDPSGDKDLYSRRLAELIRRYVARTDGRAFVLFTSYETMRRAAAELTPWLTRENLGLYSQADGLPRRRMLEQFKANPRAVLFGTDSFWQGVDVPGDALQNVIITKLPFSPPDQPLLQARLEAIRAGGGNPFVDYQLPAAVIKLRQGFGRLIRSQLDQGIVVLLDPRVRTKPYGRLFIESLPDCEVVEESADEEEF